MKRTNIFKPVLDGILLSSIVMLAAGCQKPGQKYPIARPNAGVGSVVTETRQFGIGSDSARADFGTIVVPENRHKTDSRLISIPFLRIHSFSETPAEPIFGLAGGPGMSNMSWDWSKAQMFLPKHDFVLVGYRGADGSVVLDCPEVTKALEKEDNPLSRESMQRMGRAWTACAERFRNEGVDLDGYTMLECIDDNESVRKALGYDRIDLISESYGTRVAYLYGLKHPESIFRSAMISVNPPGHFAWDPQMTDRLLKHYSTLRSEDTSTVATNTDLYECMQRVLKEMPRRWLWFSISPGKVKLVTFALLYHRNTAATVFDAYGAADHGDPSGLALMSLAYDYVIPSMTIWGEAASKAVSADYDSTRDYSAETDSSDTPLGSPMNKFMWGPLHYGHWPTRQLPGDFRKVRLSDVQTLLVSGNVDFSTPSEYATKELLPYLKNGQQVILAECGHVNDVWNVNRANARLILTSFYETGVADTKLNSYVPMDFDVRWGFPKVAKFLLGVATFLVLLFVLIVVWIARTVNRRRLRRRQTGIAGLNTGPIE